MEYKTYSVSPKDKEPLLRFIVKALEGSGCRVLRCSPPNAAPFKITFETSDGERLGIVVYAFFANSRLTKNRPDDEHRFQVKYGPDDKKLHEIWTDPFMLYTTLFVGIDPARGIFIGADPTLHNPTRFFISIEFKEHHVAEIKKCDWIAWERDHRAEDDKPVEVLVGGTAKSFLRYVKFEREALGEDQGHRQLLAERVSGPKSLLLPGLPTAGPTPSPARLHALAQEFDMGEADVLDLIASARMLKMAVRGWVAEEHLVRKLCATKGVTDCTRDDRDGMPDVRLRFRGSRIITVECKNALRQRTREGLARIDFQRTRASKGDPCSRYYGPRDFDILAGCLHAVTEKWEFKYVLPRLLDSHRKCPGKLSNNVRVDARWEADPQLILQTAVGTK